METTDISGVVSELPKEKGWIDETFLQYQGFWYHESALKGLLTLQRHFQAESTDILLASYPKSGTTWLKALIVSIIHGTQNSPLLTATPHELVRLLEAHAFRNPDPADLRPGSSSLMNTHVPYGSLPESVKASNCRIVYVCRDPKDVLVSLYHFLRKLKREGVPLAPLDTVFDGFRRGTSPYGPYWDHVLGYWKASVEFPERVLFLRYEELMNEPGYHVKRLSEFLEHALADETAVERLLDLCSFEKLSKLEVNRSGRHCEFEFPGENSFYFRLGQVGDSKNHLTAAMMDEIDDITRQKFEGLIPPIRAARI